MELGQYYDQYTTVAVFTLLGALLAGLSLGIAFLLRPHNPDRVKASIYECGVDPVEGGWGQSNVRYYVYALLFVIFDVETVFIFPWAVRLEALGVFALAEMGVFLAILLLGLVYAWRKGVLAWA